MFFGKLLKPRPQTLVGRALFQSAVGAARSAVYYADLGVPDTPEGRFELYTAHVAILLRRLAGEEPQMAETRQAVFDALIRNLDDGLREMGVGDLSVGKKMRKLAEAVYGRLKSYSEAFASDAPDEAIRALVARTVLAGADGGDAGGIAARLTRAAAHLAAQPTDRLLEGAAEWPTA